MAKPSGYVLEPLREGADFTLYRGRQHGNPLPLLALALAAEQPSPQGLRRIEHEYSLAAELDPAWAAKPLTLTRHEAQTVLILEDPGGEPLDLVLERGHGRPLDLTRVLRIAVGLASALGQVHRHGLIHKDVKPGNVLVNDAGNVWLTGFGIASQLPHERQAPAPPEIIAGTLAYMAPEQTGRMNRSIDTRSDLYSLGVTLYQMLTSRLPFSAADPLEWVHCHIARWPTPPGDCAAVPEPLSAITMKLLAKNAEERYQTASGLEADLRKCLEDWRSHGRLDPFPLGLHDVPDRLLIPEKLYGREREVDLLLAAFSRIAIQGTPELVLVSGYSGIGKSSVVNELHKVLVPQRGLFASGKFDQYRRDIPYATLAQAFQNLIRQILVKSEAEVERWRGSLQEAVDTNGQLIVNLIPELEFIIGKQPLVAELSPQDARNRFQLVFRRFLGAFARKEHPLALFLDDLQWLDAATLDLLEHLVTDPDVGYLLLVGAYRDNEVSSSHPLTRTLEAIRKSGARMQEIVLLPLRLEDVGRLLADALHCEPERATPLAQVVYEKTVGNPFFAIQFISALAVEALLTFDYGGGQWSWDLSKIIAKGFTDNVVDLVILKLNRLPVEAQKALQELACVGNSAETTTISIVLGAPEEEIHSDLLEAVRLEFIVRLESSYKFAHDRVQEAAYSLIPEELRAGAHLRIGRLLAAHTPPARREELIFEIVDQLNRGAALITSQEERDQAAELNLIAGKRAKASTAYASALKYLIAGAALLADDCWEHQHELIFALELHRGECEFLTGELLAAADRLTMLSSRATNTVDRAIVACLLVDVYTTLDQSDRAVAICLDYLLHLGVEWSAHPTAEEARREYERIWSQIGSRAIEDFMELPLMEDPGSLATLDVLTKVVPPALYTDANLVSLATCRAVNLSLESGNSDGSCVAYVWLGTIAGPHFNNYEAGFRFGRLGYELVEQRGLKRFQARTYMCFGSHVMPWTKHIQAGRDLLRRAFEAANKIGDLTVAAYSCDALNTNLLASGDPLSEVQREAEKGFEFARKAQFGIVIDIITAQLGLIRTLRGLTPKFGSFDDGQFEELQFERHLASDPVLALPECWYWIRKLQARLVSGDYASAVDASVRAQRLLWTSPSLFETAEYHFYGALSHAASWDYALPDQRQQHYEALAAHHGQLEAWAENCPENFETRVALVGAEIARIEGRALEAMQLYDQAIHSAREQGFVQNEGLAHEVAAQFYASRGFEAIANMYLRNARKCYDRWGALGKVKQLDERYPRLNEERVPASVAFTIGTTVRQLDVETVVKASQALSIEIVLPKLIEKLMQIVVEHAGAERGLLILLKGSEPRIEAEATIGHSTVEVTVRQAVIAPLDLPRSVLQYVFRTRERVVLDDASIWNLYSEDDYVRQQRPRSVLCLPIVKQTKLIGVLYLENNLTPRAFTADRVAVLELLASQAAISIENATLFSDLQRSEAYLAQGQSVSHTGSFGWSVVSGGIYWSEETYKIFELGRAVGPTLELIFQRIHPDDRDLVHQALNHATNDKTDFDFEHRLLMPDGSIKHLHVIGHASKVSSGDLEFVGAVTDVTAAKQAEMKLRESEAYLAEAQRLSHIGSWAWNPDTSEFRYWSDETFHLMGFDPAGGIPPFETFAQRFHPDDLPMIAESLERVRRERAELELDYRIIRPGGEIRNLHGVVHPVLGPSGDLVECVGSVIDFTERKQAEDSIRQSEMELRQIVDFAPQYVGVLGSNRERLYLNQASLEYIGLTLEEWQSGDNRSAVHPDDWERMISENQTKFLSGLPHEAELRLRRKDGKYRWILFRYNPLRDEQGRIRRWYVAGADIEDRKQAEQRLQNENVALREEIDRASMFEEIVGSSPALRAVLSRVSRVAPTDSTVLITGETGTGKELIARAVHKRSQRSSRAFVSVNCAAIPRDLIASELFGHEKGAFTGAMQRRLGRFELAEGGTIFLDEIGELPAETQIALLRVLQEREFERIGGAGTIQTNVRVIAATNRDLEVAIAAGIFRSDLYYRLNVFPIAVPPLRERREDIPMLVEYFIDRFARKAGKSIRSVNKMTMELLQLYSWPGNIRELQNLIERSVIVCDSENLSVDDSWLSRQPVSSEPKGGPELPRKLATREKEMIEAALRESGGRVSGPSGAAIKLGIPGSTLDSKIRSLRIDKNRFKSIYPSTDRN
ncbi:MAG: sigma 54-interacting transcriptional regulator [Candidatus Sulfotelmatobacter sp.]